MPEVKRQTAYICSIKSLLEGKYIQRPGWDPNYIVSGDMQISRVNILAVILAKENNTFVIDDATSQMQVIFFGNEEKFQNFSVGDVVLIIGRPREYNNKRFIVPEIIKKIQDSKWIEYRRLELEKLQFDNPAKNNIKEESEMLIEQESSPKSNISIKPESFEDNYASIILATIRKLDRGDGVSVNDVIVESKLEKADKYIISLINEGEIFEIRTGRLKILE